MSETDKELAQEGLGYSRVRFKVQVGDGIDQRGEASVEIMRTTEQNTAKDVRWEAEDEIEEAVEHLKDELGL